MNGFVDDQLRALLGVPVSPSRDGERTELVAWIDTAFNGGLAIPRKQVAELGLVKESSAEAILADGHSVALETFRCLIDWFGNSYETQIAAKRRGVSAAGNAATEWPPPGHQLRGEDGRTHIGTRTIYGLGCRRLWTGSL